VLFDHDDVQTGIGAALRGALDPGMSAVQVRDCLAGLGMFGVEIRAKAGGLELGLSRGVIVCAELGRAAAHDGYRAAALLADLLPEMDLPGVPPPADGIAACVVHCGPGSWRPESPDTVVLTGEGTAPDPLDGAEFLVLSLASDTNPAFGVLPAAGITASGHTGTRSARVDFGGRCVRVAGTSIALARARIRQAAYLLGCAEAAHTLATARAATRSQFGTQLGSYQAVAFPLAAQLAELAATRLLVHRAAWLADQAGPDRPLRLAATEALAGASELAFTVTRHAVHVHGAYGMTHAAPVHRYYLTAAIEATRWGSAAQLWREAAALRAPAAAQRTVVAS
jgi:hypothetical protein